MYLLDTDVLIWVLRGNRKIVETVFRLKEKKPLCISVISIAEIYKNIFPSEITLTEEYLQQHIVLSVDEKIAKQAGLYWQQYNKKLVKLTLIDCLIASTAVSTGADLFTLNAKHFPMNNLKVVKLTP